MLINKNMTLKKLDRAAVEDRKERSVRVLQFGEGNFLRAFADLMLDVANEKGITDTGVAVVSPRFGEGRAVKALKEQQGIYHVVLEGIEGGMPKREIRMVSSVADVLAPVLPDDMERYRAYITSPDLRFVISNTTEAGIRYDADDVFAAVPSTFPGKIVSLLWQRFSHFGGDPARGLIFLPCELIEDNGTTLRSIVLRHAEEAGFPQAFIDWVKNDNIFVDTLVDRIVPGFPADTIDEVKAELGYDDNAVVKGELYHLWAIGGDGYRAVASELPLDKAGLQVLFMPSIKAFRDKKVRVLNGSHTGMVPVALQLGCETVMDAFNDADVNRFVRGMVANEVLPMIDGDKDELRQFADSILERFYNPYIKHYLKSISLNSLSKWEARNWPTVKDLWQEEGREAEYEAFTFAALLSLYGPGSGFIPEDNAGHIEVIRSAWNDKDYTSTVNGILNAGIFIENFAELVPDIPEVVAGYLSEIRNKGMRAALADFLKTHA